MKTIGITGGTGFLGKHLTELLVSRGYDVIIFTRDPKEHPATTHIRYALWNIEKQQADVKAIASLDAVVHLAGESIAAKRWTAKRKQEILESRILGTSFLVKQLMMYGAQCNTFISASAIGYYGPDNGREPFTEDMPPANDFLADVCKQWEAACIPIEQQMRCVLFRFGIIMGKDGGAFPQFEKSTRFGILPMLGGGRQIISWIHVEDLSLMLLHALEQDEMKGAFNAVSPTPVSQRLLMYTIQHNKGRLPIGIPIPAFALKLALGEMSIELLKSCTVSNAKIAATGFIYEYPTIASAVGQILSNK